ncbi:MAG: serine/threonine protein phosphatase [Oscillospiraceae bacterium]|nr:serine/threonine protein phosphatase [Oscillospiraceae bacterium]
MEFFRSKKSKEAAVQTVSSDLNVRHPFSAIENYNPLTGFEMKLYSTLKEAVPIIDAATSKIVRLVGDFRISCEDKDIEYEINKFMQGVQVNACGLGASSFILTHLNQLLTYGTAVGEIVVNGDGNRIKALYNAFLGDVELKVDSSPLKLKICRKKENGESEEIKYPELILISALNPEPGHIYGNSIMKGLPFISNILLKIYNSIGTNWERIGNVRFAVTYKPSSDAGERAYAKDRAKQIAEQWGRAMKDSNHPSDFIAVGDVGIKVIGADNQILDSQVPVRQMLEQIISKLSIPPFLLGLSWSTTETMSNQQADILSSELEGYRRLLNPIINKICNIWLGLSGYISDYKIVWENVNLKDELQLSNARLNNAKAREIEQRINENEGSDPN